MRIFIALLFMPMAAFAADWVLLAATQEVEIEIDRHSVRANKGAWFKYIHTPPASESCAGTAKKQAYSKNYVEANCKDFTIRSKQIIAYADDGSVLDYCGYNDPKVAFTEYAPETVGEVYFNAICDPRSRVLNKDAVALRKIKEYQFELEAEERRKEAEAREARRRSEERILNEQKMRAITEAQARADPTKKQKGELCTSSSECAGTWICEGEAPSRMRCVDSDEYFKFKKRWP